MTTEDNIRTIKKWLPAISSEEFKNYPTPRSYLEHLGFIIHASTSHHLEYEQPEDFLLQTPDGQWLTLTFENLLVGQDDWRSWKNDWADRQKFVDQAIQDFCYCYQKLCSTVDELFLRIVTIAESELNSISSSNSTSSGLIKYKVLWYDTTKIAMIKPFLSPEHNIQHQFVLNLLDNRLIDVIETAETYIQNLEKESTITDAKKAFTVAAKTKWPLMFPEDDDLFYENVWYQLRTTYLIPLLKIPQPLWDDAAEILLEQDLENPQSRIRLRLNIYNTKRLKKYSDRQLSK